MFRFSVNITCAWNFRIECHMNEMIVQKIAHLSFFQISKINVSLLIFLLYHHTTYLRTITTRHPVSYNKGLHEFDGQYFMQQRKYSTSEEGIVSITLVDYPILYTIPCEFFLNNLNYFSKNEFIYPHFYLNYWSFDERLRIMLCCRRTILNYSAG